MSWKRLLCSHATCIGIVQVVYTPTAYNSLPSPFLLYQTKKNFRAYFLPLTYLSINQKIQLIHSSKYI